MNRFGLLELNLLEELLEKNRDITSTLDTNYDGPILPLAIRQNLCLFVKQRADDVEQCSARLQQAMDLLQKIAR